MATRNTRQVVMTFDERPDLSSPRIRGGKGASLTDMRALGLPVPPGFTISTTIARAVMQHGAFPKRFEWQLARGISSLEKATGKKFGDIKNPLLVSVRSGAEVSMPGMMDTVLNLGLNDEIAEGLAALTNIEFAEECQMGLQSMYSLVVNSYLPWSPQEQLRSAIVAVINSWNSDRAKAYRAVSGISDTLGTAVTIQAMVFGNRSERSGTGVVFSRDPNTGEGGMYGEFLAKAQGEDVVSGKFTPMPISAMHTWNAGIYEELAGYVKKLEQHFDAIVDIEFTVEEGKLWLLQCRAAKLSAQASATFAVHQVWDKRWSKEKATTSLTQEQIEVLKVPTAFVAADIENHQDTFAGSGIAASPGAVVGSVALTSKDAIAMKAAGECVVLVRPETTPDDLPGMLAASAIITFAGGATSHAAVVARQLGIPAVVGVNGHQPIHRTAQGEKLSVCGNTGQVFFGALPVDTSANKKEVNIFLRWANGLGEPKIDFEAAKKRESVNRILAEVYLLEAMTLAAKGSAIEHEVVKMRNSTLVETAEFFACYLAIAVVGELRYAWGLTVKNHVPLQLKKMEEVFGISGSQDRGDESILPILKSRPIKAQIEFFELGAEIFNRGWGKSTSIGGPKWAAIAQAAADFLSGKLKHGVFVDHVFDLRHNGGVLFDKHSMVSRLTSEYAIREQLDYKRTCNDLGELYHRMGQHAMLNSTTPFGLLWQKGKKLNLWKEKENGSQKQARKTSPFYATKHP